MLSCISGITALVSPSGGNIGDTFPWTKQNVWLHDEFHCRILFFVHQALINCLEAFNVLSLKQKNKPEAHDIFHLGSQGTISCCCCFQIILSSCVNHLILTICGIINTECKKDKDVPGLQNNEVWQHHKEELNTCCFLLLNRDRIISHLCCKYMDFISP